MRFIYLMRRLRVKTLMERDRPKSTSKPFLQMNEWRHQPEAGSPDPMNKSPTLDLEFMAHEIMTKQHHVAF